ncbi:MAG: helix-turn-helix domain-containing protein [Phenylobacterium sp.]|uniref:AraC family transcriptional regulator n=1 Tax=Phenylobacterium sp. TaxID=1871053 RepID=UPI00391D17A9
MLRSTARAELAPIDAAVPGAASEPGQVLSLKANSVLMRLQPPSAFELRYEGDRPLLIYAFGAVQGTAVIEGGRARPVASRAGTFALLRPGVRSSFSHPEPLEVLAVAYDPDAPAGVAPPGEPAGELADAGMRNLAHEARRVLLEEARPDSDYLEALGRAMLARAVQVADGSAPQRGRGLIAPFKMRRVLEHIDANLPERLSVQDLAQVADLSPSHFARAFRQTTGEAPHHYILSRRIEKVREFLHETDLDLATVAFRAGFSSHAHMTSAFRKQMGMSPTAYRAAVTAA